MNTEKYKKFLCIKCSNEWFGFAKKPRCKNCNSRKINIYPARIENIQLEQLGAKINLEKNEKMVEEKTEELEENFDFVISNNKIEDEIKYKCGNCQEQNINYGDLYCNDCGQALDVEWQ